MPTATNRRSKTVQQTKSKAGRPLYLKLGLAGQSDAGKTYTALQFAKAIGGKWNFLDAEGGRVDWYLDNFDLDSWCDREYLDDEQEFDHEPYVNFLSKPEGYKGLIIDSLSMWWLGILDYIEDHAEAQAKKWNARPNTFSAWGGSKGGNRRFLQVMDAVRSCKCHTIVTFRAKPEYEMDGNKPQLTGEDKVIFRQGQYRYEFVLFGWLERSRDGKRRNMFFEKTADCKELEGKSFPNPGEETVKIIRDWMKRKNQEL